MPWVHVPEFLNVPAPTRDIVTVDKLLFVTVTPPFTLTISAKDIGLVPVRNWSLVANLAAPAENVPALSIPPSNLRFVFEVTAVVLNVVDAPILTFPTKVAILVLSLSVNPPLTVVVVVPMMVKSPVLEFVTIAPVMATSLANDKLLPPVMAWLLVLKVAPPAVKVPSFTIPPRNTSRLVVVTAVVINEVEVPTPTLPTKVVTPVLSESVRPPLVERVVVPLMVRLAVLEFVTIAPVMATSLANDKLLPPVMAWLLVLKVAPPAVKVPAFAIPPLKTSLAVFVMAVVINEVEAPTLTLPTRSVIPVLFESVKPPLVEREVLPVMVKLLVFELVTVTPVMATLLPKERLFAPVMAWLLVLNVAPPAINIPPWAIPPLKTMFALDVTAVEIKEVPDPTLTFPPKMVSPLLLESVNPPLVDSVMVEPVPPNVTVPKLLFVKVMPAIFTLLTKEMFPFPDNAWLFVLNVPPPPEKPGAAFEQLIPPLKIMLAGVVTTVEIHVPSRVTNPVKVEVPVLLESVREDEVGVMVVVPPMVTFPGVLKVISPSAVPLRLPPIVNEPALTSKVDVEVMATFPATVMAPLLPKVRPDPIGTGVAPPTITFPLMVKLPVPLNVKAVVVINEVPDTPMLRLPFMVSDGSPDVVNWVMSKKSPVSIVRLVIKTLTLRVTWWPD